MQEDQLHEDIQFIKRMIENNRRTLVDNGITYITIGVYVGIGSLISYAFGITGHENLLPGFWLAMMACLITVILFLQKKVQRKEKKKKTFATEIFAATWMACAIPIIVVTVLFFITGRVALSSLYTTIASVLGIGYYLTGYINDLRFMKLLAFGWWIGAALSILWIYIGREYQLSLLFSALITLFELVPGIIIYNKWKKVFNG